MVVFTEVESCLESRNCRKRSELAKKLVALTEKNGYQIIQTNGQRVYAPPASKNCPSPSKGCEVFIGKLHKNLYEDELIPLFEKVGPLYKFRLMLDFMEQTRGYAFATYFTPQDASRAVEKLNKFEIRPKLKIVVYKSVDNRRLFIGNLPTDRTRLEVQELLKRYVNGVVDVIMYPDYHQPWLNRGFVFVEFEEHRYAALARRQFTPENLVAWGQTLYVDWADPIPEVEPHVMARVTILYLKNLPLDYNSEEIHTIICNVIGSQVVRKVHKMFSYAFVHLVNRKHAELALSKLQGLIIRDQAIEIEWARPRRYSKKFRLSKTPDNFCTSVPPSMRRLVQQRMSELSFSSHTTSPRANNNSSSLPTNTLDTTMDSFYKSFSDQIPVASTPFSVPPQSPSSVQNSTFTGEDSSDLFTSFYDATVCGSDFSSFSKYYFSGESQFY